MENVEFAKRHSVTFPSDVSVLLIHSDLDWHHNVETIDQWPLQISDDGSVVIYRYYFQASVKCFHFLVHKTEILILHFCFQG